MNEFFRRMLFLPPQASRAAREIDGLHYVVITATMVGACGVFLVAVYFVARYGRASPRPLTPRITMPLALEVLLLGGTLSLFMTFWFVGYGQFNRLQTPPANAMTVYVSARQWMWHFAYTDGRNALGTLTVPAGRPVRLVMTSRDVIHSFFVPAFRIKYDVLPGRYVTTWFEATRPGVYDVLCAEYCGLSHSRMRAAVVVLSPADYAAWLERTRGRGGADRAGDAEGTLEMPDLAREGREVATRRACFACHTVDGQRHIGPTWRGLFGARVALRDGRTVVADEAYLTRSMMDPTVDVVAGFAPVMPTYRAALPAHEVAALVEYLRALERRGPEPSVDLPAVAETGVAVPARSAQDLPEGAAAAGAIGESGPPVDGGSRPAAAPAAAHDGGTATVTVPPGPSAASGSAYPQFGADGVARP